MPDDYSQVIEQFRNDLAAEIEKSRTKLTTQKSNNFHSDFETETDRIDSYASKRIQTEFNAIPSAILDEPRKRLHQAFVTINIELRNEFRQSYMEMKAINDELV